MGTLVCFCGFTERTHTKNVYLILDQHKHGHILLRQLYPADSSVSQDELEAKQHPLPPSLICSMRHDVRLIITVASSLELAILIKQIVQLFSLKLVRSIVITKYGYCYFCVVSFISFPTKTRNPRNH